MALDKVTFNVIEFDETTLDEMSGATSFDATFRSEERERAWRQLAEWSAVCRRRSAAALGPVVERVQCCRRAALSAGSSSSSVRRGPVRVGA